MINQIKKSFKVAKDRNFDKLFYYFDVHETILVPDYNNLLPLQFYPYAKEALQLIGKNVMIIMGLFTCSHPEEIEKYQNFFKENDINFKYVNENPEVSDTILGNFSTGKFYFNVLFEDKCGFDAITEWKEIYEYFKNYNR